MVNDYAQIAAQEAANGFNVVVDTLDAQNRAREATAGIDPNILKGIQFSADNKQVAALNNEDMSRGPSGGLSV